MSKDNNQVKADVVNKKATNTGLGEHQKLADEFEEGARRIREQEYGKEHKNDPIGFEEKEKLNSKSSKERHERDLKDIRENREKKIEEKNEEIGSNPIKFIANYVKSTTARLNAVSEKPENKSIKTEIDKYAKENPEESAALYKRVRGGTALAVAAGVAAVPMFVVNPIASVALVGVAIGGIQTARNASAELIHEGQEYESKNYIKRYEDKIKNHDKIIDDLKKEKGIDAPNSPSKTTGLAKENLNLTEENKEKLEASGKDVQTRKITPEVIVGKKQENIETTHQSKIKQALANGGNKIIEKLKEFNNSHKDNASKKPFQRDLQEYRQQDKKKNQSNKSQNSI